jgi:hypothetical protein
MKLSMTGQEKGDLLIQVTAWGGLTVFFFFTAAISNSPKQITGSISSGRQQHFQMETQVCNSML